MRECAVDAVGERSQAGDRAKGNQRYDQGVLNEILALFACHQIAKAETEDQYAQLTAPGKIGAG